MAAPSSPAPARRVPGAPSPSAAGTPSAARVRQIVARLERALGPLEPPRRWDPLEELILTVLSQNTSDLNSERAFAALRERWPTWEALAVAPEPELVDAIRPGGLANTKAPRILAILRTIADREDGAIDLSWMHSATDAAVGEYLLSLPGVGPKTAACVLAFSLERDAIPVDTHVHRVARRLGFYDERTDAAAAHRVLEQAVPPKLRVPLHVGLIRLGRQICRPGRPLCEECPLNDLCPTAPIYLGGGPAGKRQPKARPKDPG
jgi:endonuclease-3